MSVLGYAAVNEADMREAVKRLGEALQRSE
jgi:hypothetical protein